jgi:phosphohistidine swiveling domain-containing protein
MPGMMTTVINIGINDQTVLGLANHIGERAAYGAYCRAIISFATGALGMPPDSFDPVWTSLRERYGAKTNQDLPVSALQEAVGTLKGMVGFPQDPFDQLRLAIEGVFGSWNRPEAIKFRRIVGIPDEVGSALSVQKMVWGNLADQASGSGVYFTCDPQTGQDSPRATFIAGAQGPDVVGMEVTHYLNYAYHLPLAFRDELIKAGELLEANFGYPQEMEVVFDGQLWFLQTRKAQLSPAAAILVRYRGLEKKMSRGYLAPEEVTQLIAGMPDIAALAGSYAVDSQEVAGAIAEGRLLGRGLSSSPGISYGQVVFTIEEARELAKQNIPVVLVVGTISQEELMSLPENVQSILSRYGGGSSHAAQIIRGMLQIPAILGFDTSQITKGMMLTVDGNTGMVFAGEMRLVKAALPPELERLLKYCQEVLKNNPWLAATYPTEEEYSFNSLARNVFLWFHLVKGQWQSPKAWAIALGCLVFPTETRLQYHIFGKNNIEGISAAVLSALAGGNEASLRTCHYPPTLATAPWTGITNPSQLGTFLTGQFRRWLANHALTEVAVGINPRGKLNEEFAKEHCVFTIQVLGGEVVIQVFPHTAHLRTLDKKFINQDASIILRATIDRHSPYGLGPISTLFGRDVANDPQAQQFADLVKRTVFEQWWRPPVALPNRMAALGQEAGMNAIECQARIRPDGTSWCLIYGGKGVEEGELKRKRNSKSRR